MLELARLYMQTGDLDACQQYCMQALRLSADGNDQASMVGGIVCQPDITLRCLSDLHPLQSFSLIRFSLFDLPFGHYVF